MIDTMLDRIEVMLLKLNKDDPYKEALESDYALYRKILEALPRDVNLPDKLYSSVFSLEQRLHKYVMLGKSSNPMQELSPTISKKITDEDEKASLLEFVNSNASYISNRKTKLDVLNAYLSRINYDGTLSDISSTIELVEKEYIESKVYSNEFEKELAKAKYQYMIKLILGNNFEQAENLAQTFSYDMVWVIYNRHKDSVHKLIDEGRATLAKELNDFLTELPQDKEKDIAFWKVLTQIENPTYVLPEDITQIQNSTDIIVPDEEKKLIPAKKRWFHLPKIFRKKANAFSNFHKGSGYAFEINEGVANLTIYISRTFSMPQSDLEKLCAFLEKAYVNNKDAFTNVFLTVIVESYVLVTPGQVSFKTIIDQISKWALLNIDFHSRTMFHEIDINFLGGCLFKSISLHGGSWAIAKESFSQNVLLEKVDLSNVEVIKIEDYAFSDCTSLIEVKLPYNMPQYSLGEGVFNNCRALENINWPVAITRVPKNIFSGCKKLQKIGLSTIEVVEDGAFKECKNLTSIGAINLKEVGKHAFFGCKSLQSISFTKSCQVDDYAFAYSGLKSATLDVHFKGSGIGVFKGSSLQTITFTGELALMSEMFMDCRELVSVNLDSGTSVLANEVFSGCTNLKTISGPSNFMHIGDACFKDCITLKHISVSPFASTVGKNAFENCINLISIVFPKLETIEAGTFKGCTSLEEVTFGDLEKNPIHTIGNSAFKNCERLRDFIFCDGIRVIGSNAFENTDLVKITLPKSVVEIGESAFTNCKYLREVTILSNIRVIPSHIFSGCSNLRKVDMSQIDVFAIEANAFSDCEMLKEIHFGKSIRNISSSAFENDFISTIILPKDVFYEFKTVGNRGDELLKAMNIDDRHVCLSADEDSDIVTITVADKVTAQNNGLI